MPAACSSGAPGHRQRYSSCRAPRTILFAPARGLPQGTADVAGEESARPRRARPVRRQGLKYHWRMPTDPLERPVAGLAGLPEVVDLRALSDEDLERRGLDLRRRIADIRVTVNAALEERSYRQPAGDGRNRRIAGFVEELQLVQEALRSALADVDREQDRRVESALREREARILDSTRWATWAAFAAAAAAAFAGIAALVVR